MRREIPGNSGSPATNRKQSCTSASSTWKASQFNEYLGELSPNLWVIYNNRSGAMIEVPEPLYNLIKKRELENLPKPEYYQALEHGKFIVRSESSEIEELKREKKQAEDEAAAIGLQILPTLACNCACTYCFEPTPGELKTMSREVMDAVIGFLKDKIKPTTQHLGVQFFGGEPTLAMDRIQYLSEAFLELCKKHKLRYSASMVTNGVLLDEKNIDVLRKYHIYAIQVTLDGPRDIHDQRRMLKGGGKTWDVIINNLKTAVEKKMQLFLRMNLDRGNIDSIEELVRELKEHGIFEHAKLSFGLVTSFNNVCRSISHELLTLEEVNRMIKERDIQGLIKKENDTPRRPIPDVLGCVATVRNSVIVGPEGELYKCSKNIGDASEQSGTIFNFDEEHPNFKKWLTVDNLEEKTCGQCGMVSFCRGTGCAFENIIEEKDIYDCDQRQIHENHLKRLHALYQYKRKADQQKSETVQGADHGSKRGST